MFRIKWTAFGTVYWWTRGTGLSRCWTKRELDAVTFPTRSEAEDAITAYHLDGDGKGPVEIVPV